MVEALVLESFVTAIACLCASSYGPRDRPIHLKDNIVAALTDWDREDLKVFVNSKWKFSFQDKFGNCHLPQSDALDTRANFKESRQKLLVADQKEIEDLKQEIDDLREALKKITASVQQNRSLHHQYKMDQIELERLRTEKKHFINQINDLKGTIENLIYNNTLLKINQEKLETLGRENKVLEQKISDLKGKNNDFNIQIKNLKSMAPPKLRSLKNDCLMAAESGVANLELRIKEDVFCTKDLDAKFGSGWILIAQRFDGSVNFNRSWNEYANGFGAYGQKTEFFAGLERIYTLTQNSSQELLLTFTDTENKTRFAHYDDFLITNEKEGFELKNLGHYQGDAGDALTDHLNQTFSTYDKDNASNCARKHAGGWWYIPNSCIMSNLLNHTKRSKNDLQTSNGMSWSTFHNTSDGNLTTMRMFLRPINFQIHIIIL